MEDETLSDKTREEVEAELTAEVGKLLRGLHAKVDLLNESLPLQRELAEACAAERDKLQSRIAELADELRKVTEQRDASDVGVAREARKASRDALFAAADDLEEMSSAITPNMGTANGAIMKGSIVKWLRKRAGEAQYPARRSHETLDILEDADPRRERADRLRSDAEGDPLAGGSYFFPTEAIDDIARSGEAVDLRSPQSARADAAEADRSRAFRMLRELHMPAGKCPTTGSPGCRVCELLARELPAVPPSEPADAVELTPYERVNLLWALRWIADAKPQMQVGADELNTGDWVCQVVEKLEGMARPDDPQTNGV